MDEEEHGSGHYINAWPEELLVLSLGLAGCSLGPDTANLLKMPLPFRVVERDSARLNCCNVHSTPTGLSLLQCHVHLLQARE